MAEVIFNGASDDLVEFDGAIYEEFDVNGFWRARLLAPNGDYLIVTAEFSSAQSFTSEWTLGIENGTTWPGWQIRFTNRPDRGDDPAIVIDVPDGTVVEEL